MPVIQIATVTAYLIAVVGIGIGLWTKRREAVGANQNGHLQRRPLHLRCLGVVFVG